MNKKKILCTLGPQSLNKNTIEDLETQGAALFRINLSHTNIEDLEDVIYKIRQYTKVPICIDTEGAQIRTTKFNYNFIENEVIELFNVNNDFSLRPFDVVMKESRVGDIISIDFNDVFVEVVDIKDHSLILKTLKPGETGENKAVSFNRDIKIPSFSDKDYKAFEIASKFEIYNYAISFSSSKEDVNELRKHIPNDSFVISKIESKKGLKNLEEIIDESDAVLIDRGDLSREVSLEKIPYFQKNIIQKTLKKNKEVYVATNLLESMIENPLPTRAEVNDVYNTLLDGASGLVLAAETAIGKHPVDSVKIINKIIDFYSYIEKMKNNEDSKNLFLSNI